MPLGAITNASMREHTSFHIGGAADLLFIPKSTDELVFALNCAESFGVPVFVMGNGSNLLVHDRGIRGLVIKIKGSEAQIEFDDEHCTMTVSASTLFSVAVKRSVDAGFMGLEWGAGIPGTVGGAISMNAGAYGGEVKNCIKSVDALVKENGSYKVKRFDVCDSDMGYRYSRFSYPEFIITGAEFTLMKDDGEAAQRMAEYTLKRTSKQPLSYPSAGSVFKRPVGHFAGALIEQAGLKGKSVGGAQVSELHAGFIINTGNATADDVCRLIKLIKEKVHDESGVMLEEELKITGG